LKFTGPSPYLPWVLCILWATICCLHYTGSHWTRLEYNLVDSDRVCPGRTCYQECGCHL